MPNVIGCVTSKVARERQTLAAKCERATRFACLLAFAALAATGCSAKAEPTRGAENSGGADSFGGTAPASAGTVSNAGSGTTLGGANGVGGSSSGAAGGASTAGGAGAGAGAAAGASNGGTSSALGGASSAAGASSAGAGAGGAAAVLMVPGVVVVDNTAGTTTCVPLCQINTNPATDPEMDDWSYENGHSCVYPGTVTGKNQGCTTGEPLPAPLSVPGVVVVDSGITRCAPLCTITTNIANDPDGDGWSYENNSSCVIPGTLTASNQACMTGQPLPAPLPRPGIVVNTGTSATGECVPLCQVATTPSDPTAPDWGYENNASCVLPNSPTALGKMSCTFNAPAPVFKPPALSGTTLKDGFYTQGGKLYDAYGNAFVMRGVNNADIFFDTSARFLAWGALDNIASYNTNTVRVVWETSGAAALLAEVLYRVVELKMVPVVELHDVTGNQDTQSLLNMVAYYTSADVKQVLQDFRAYLLINIANEWSGQSNYASAYQSAIQQLRSAGINHTLVIDASGYGQDANSIFSNANALMNADPQKNLLFSLHMYDNYPSASSVDSALTQASSSAIPLIVGEFGFQLNGKSVAWQEVLAKCGSLGIGYIAWSWMGNDSTNAQLDMASDWEGPLTTWGENVLTGTNGIQSTAHRASIFK